MAKLTPEENRIVELINRIAKARETSNRERNMPEFIESEHAEDQSYAEKALKSFRAGEVAKTKALFWAANAYFERSRRDEKETGGGRVPRPTLLPQPPQPDAFRAPRAPP